MNSDSPNKSTKRIAKSLIEETSSLLGQDKNNHLAAIILGSYDAILSKSLNGVITSWNQGAQKMFGYTEAEAIGYSIDLIVPDKSSDREIVGVEKDLEFIPGGYFEGVRQCKDGKKIIVSVTVSPIFDAKGIMVGTSEVARDITIQKNIEKKLQVANKELAFQNAEKANRAAELVLANKELAFQNAEKANRAAELVLANKELAFQNAEKAKRAAELVLANKELAYQNQEKERRVQELVLANAEKAKRAAELVLANKELAYQNQEKERRVQELVLANAEKANRAAELVVANAELSFQNHEKDKRSAELIIANEEKVRLKSLNAEKLRQSLMETINIARQLVELRDPYTAGHEKHVGNLAKAIAAEMGLDESRQEGMMIAGYLHDIGKIIVPVEILCKPGKITQEEFSLIKNHVQASYDLLKDVTFPWDISQAVLEHHERLDGSGYPNHLKVDQISIAGRILGVADVLDAMFSYRPYRPALGMELALTEIRRGRGTLYDEKVVDACLKLFYEKNYKITAD